MLLHVLLASDHLVNLRLTSKQMIRGSKKCEISEKEAKTKLKKAIEARNTEGARIYAQVTTQTPVGGIGLTCLGINIHRIS